MRAFIDECVGEVPGQGLGRHQSSQVAGGNEERIFGVEELRELPFQRPVDGVIPRGQARRGGVQTESLQSVVRRLQDGGMACEAKIITTRKVGEFASATADKGTVHLLERLGFGHGGSVSVWLPGIAQNELMDFHDVARLQREIFAFEE